VRVLIVGAGIGGLSAAIALQRRGIEAVLVERTTELKEIGAGIAIAANAMKALDSLGLADALWQIGAEPPFYEIRSWRGEVLSRVSVSEQREKLGATSVAAHRADLQAALLQGLTVAGGKVHLGTECVGFEQAEGYVRASFASGREERGDLLIGADGLNSTVRAHLLGDGPPRYAGYTAWRAVVRPQRELVPRGAVESWGRGRRFLVAPIGRGRVYWAAAKNAPQGAQGEPDESEKESLLRTFQDWHEPTEELIRGTDERTIVHTDIYDRDPLGEPWGEGRISLLGDAAHPMTPDLGQGACQAIEDAVELAKCLSEESEPASALRHYEAHRTRRVAVIVRRSRRLGRVAQLENPLLCQLRDVLLKVTPDQVLLRQAEELVTHER
jgi:2-polyprenyl-6-methoxyphenol hydroxylase-like FAD-dependent oxidoreductase